jgi:hypothetical protein
MNHDFNGLYTLIFIHALYSLCCYFILAFCSYISVASVLCRCNNLADNGRCTFFMHWGSYNKSWEVSFGNRWALLINATKFDSTNVLLSLHSYILDLHGFEAYRICFINSYPRINFVVSFGRRSLFCEISGSYTDEYVDVDYCFLGRCTIQSCKNWLTFQKRLLPPSSGQSVWWWRYNAPLKSRLNSTGIQSAKSQKTAFSILVSFASLCLCNAILTSPSS